MSATSEYLEIRTATLRPQSTLGFDVYLSIAGKFILYFKNTDMISVDQYEKFYRKNVRKVYIKPDHRLAYEKYLDASANAALKNGDMPMEEKSNIIGGLSKGAVEDMFENPGEKENYKRTNKAANNHVELLLKHPQALEHLLKAAQKDKSIYQHSVNVATIAIGLSAAFGADSEVCQVVGIGGLLHDIGKDPEISDSVPIDQMAPEIKEKYIQHPRAGADMLKGKDYVSKDVLDIILLHEERIDGKGFPSGIQKIDQIFQVVGLANLYDRQVTYLNKSPKEAYEYIIKMETPPYDADMIAGMKEVLINNNLYK